VVVLEEVMVQMELQEQLTQAVVVAEVAELTQEQELLQVALAVQVLLFYPYQLLITQVQLQGHLQ
jgi:hypothetical protein